MNQEHKHKTIGIAVQNASEAGGQRIDVRRVATRVVAGALALGAAVGVTSVSLDRQANHDRIQYQRELQRDGLTSRTDDGGAQAAQHEAGQAAPTDSQLPAPEQTAIVYDPTNGQIEHVPATK